MAKVGDARAACEREGSATAHSKEIMLLHSPLLAFAGPCLPCTRVQVAAALLLLALVAAAACVDVAAAGEYKWSIKDCKPGGPKCGGEQQPACCSMKRDPSTFTTQCR